MCLRLLFKGGLLGFDFFLLGLKVLDFCVKYFILRM